MKKKMLALVLALVMAAALFVPTAAASEDVDVTALPRHETLFIAGHQWGSINGWNALSSDMNNSLAVNTGGAGSSMAMFETLYMYNMLDNSFVPLLAYGDPVWGEGRRYMTVQLNPNATWNDGTPVTAFDVHATWEFALALGTGMANGFRPFIDRIDVIDMHTFNIVNVLIDGQPANPLMTYSFIAEPYILQRDWMIRNQINNNFDAQAQIQDFAEDIAFSGPFGPFFADDTRVIMIRNDNYWGQHESMWGTLPAPRFLAHMIFEDNAAGDLALMAGEVDVSQQFHPNVQDFWLEMDLPISTFMLEAPFGIGSSLPTMFFNMNVPALQNVYVRRAIAMAVDYDAIIANAMTGQSATFHEVPRSLMNPTAGEQAMFDSDAVAHLQWAGNDIDGANALLDEAGILRNADGWRELDGEVLAFVAHAPQGWSDWEAAVEIVAAAGDLIGIQITTLFPDWAVYQTVVTTPANDYDMFMMWSDSSSPVQPWGRIRQLLSSEFPPLESNWSGNWGHWSNERIDEIIRLIPLESDPDVLLELYTEAVYLYLYYVPSFTLMYRPANFHTVNETVWTGFTEYGDGRNVPPMNAFFGYAMADMFNIHLVDPGAWE